MPVIFENVGQITSNIREFQILPASRTCRATLIKEG